MKELERIKLPSTAQLGSLEEAIPVKRITPEQIRKLRLQAHQQTQMHFSLLRAIVKSWHDIRAQFGLLFRGKTDICKRAGHSVSKYGGIMHCRNCHMEILSIDELRESPLRTR